MHCLKIINIIIWRILKFYDEKMKKSLIVAMLSMLLSVNVLTPMSYAVENVWELSGIAENGGEIAENGANGLSWTEGEGSYEWQTWNQLDSSAEPQNDGSDTQDSSAEPQNDDNMSSWTEWRNLDDTKDSSLGAQNDGSDEQVPQNDGRDTQDSSSQTSQNDWQDAPAPVDPEDPVLLPVAQPMLTSNSLLGSEPQDTDSLPTQRSTEVKDLHLYFVNGNETKHYTIMDRNMGATGVRDEWYYYQWWNNWGFDYPPTVTTTTPVPYETWSNYWPSEYESWTFVMKDSVIKNNTWQAWPDDKLFNNNQWWWQNDKTCKGMTLTEECEWEPNGPWEKEDRQWPCSDGYYVPSAYDFASVLDAWTKSSSTYDVNYHVTFYDEFASDLLLPLAWSIDHTDLNISGKWEKGDYWTSSPNYGPRHDSPKSYSEKSNSRRLALKNNQFNVGSLQRSSWISVRCFKNDFNPDGSTTWPLTIHLNGGEKAVIAVDSSGHIYTLNTPSYPNDEKEFKWRYTTPNFIKWTRVEKDDNINWSTGLYARWSDVEESVIVTFVNEDGTELQSWAVLSGTTLTNEAYTWATPTKEATVQLTYTFSWWYPDFVPLTDHTIYTAKFNETVNKYKVTFVDEDGTTVLQEATEYDYGTASGDITKPADPTKVATAEYTYTFAGWTPAIVDVTTWATYTATYTATKNKYTIKFVNEDWTELQSSDVEYGETPSYTESTPTKAADAQYTYAFSGWTPELAEVTTWATYTATYKPTLRRYTITWKNDDGSVIGTTKIPYWAKPIYEDQTKDNTAEYTYTFAGWDPEVVAVTWDATYKATFSSTKNKYKVTFKDAEWNVISEKEIEYGQTPTAPADPTKEWHTFSGWNPVVWPVTGDVNYEPTFTINKHTVTWQNYDGSELEKDENVEYWTTPAYDWATPTREADAQYTYTFTTWSPAIAPVTGNIVYRAIYSGVVNEYTITFLDEDGSELYKYSVPYGMMPFYSGETPTKEGDSKYTYTFAGWTPSLAAVTWDARYTAKFDSKKKWWNRSGGWKGWNSDSNTHGSADEQDSSTTSQNDSSSLSWTDMNDLNWEAQELFDVHKWAYENWLTRYANINDARMNDPINRAEMAKISSIFDINFLWKTPDESKEYECSQYSDISIPDLWEELRYFVVQSCELWNMWYSYDNMNYISDFMPYDPLNVAQASVILSRMAWWKRYIIGPEMWYQWHIYAVYDNALLDDTSDPWRHITRREAFTAFYRLDNLLNKTN